MEAIKLIRLKSGEDIVAYIEQVDKLNFVVREPMVVITKYDNRSGNNVVLIDHWLPTSIIRHNEAFITESEIITMLEPSSAFTEYYEKSVQSNNGTFDFSDTTSSDEEVNSSLTKDEMMMLLEMVGPNTTQLIH
jgi:hypothetical protein